MIRVMIFDFDGTFYSGKHKFDNVESKVRKNRRKFLSGLTDDEYSSIIKKYPQWENQVSGRDIVEFIYKIKNENPDLKVSANDFWQWQQENDYEIIIDDKEVVKPDYIHQVCQKYHSYLVSNSSPSHLKRYMQRLGIEEEWFKDVVSNRFEEFDQTKQHYYYDIMKSEGVKGEEVLVVGDSDIADLQPARLLNMQTLLIKNANELKEKLEKVLGGNNG